MSGLRTVSVALAERSYDISIEMGAVAKLRDLLENQLQASHAILVVDQAVHRWWQPMITGSAAIALRHSVVEVPSGETSKSVEALARLWQEFQTAGADRMSVIVAVGGGVIGDLAGFAAATFARGLRFVQVPTTLLAMVDSSVGGKTGINLPTAKNMVGAFWQPAAVLIDPATLESLPAREYVSGLAEVVKYGVILDEAFFGFLEENVAAIRRRDPAVLVPIIARCCELKAKVVQADERETSGLRAILNYGHTFAHAFENLLGYGTLLHGEAVAIGMDCAARLAVDLGRVEPVLVERQRQLLLALGLPVDVPKLETAAILDTMRRDKKVAHGQLRFVLPDRLGHVALVGDVPQETVESILDASAGAGLT